VSFIVLSFAHSVFAQESQRGYRDDVYFPPRRHNYQQKQHQVQVTHERYQQPHRTNVGVFLPGIYEMGLGTGNRGTGLGINVLGGLVRINLNRERDPLTGRRKRPSRINVNVGGSDVYSQNN